MVVYVDPPLWPRHGRIWGHLVSDSSLEELHDVARAAGIPERGFDLDHYDVPAELYPTLRGLGVVEIGTRDLVRRLRASGLRVTSAERHGR
jgi:hypothetical protein